MFIIEKKRIHYFTGWIYVDFLFYLCFENVVLFLFISNFVILFLLNIFLKVN